MESLAFFIFDNVKCVSECVCVCGEKAKALKKEAKRDDALLIFLYEA